MEVGCDPHGELGCTNNFEGAKNPLCKKAPMPNPFSMGALTPFPLVARNPFSIGTLIIDTIQRNISKELLNLCKWLDSNRLRLNIAKSKFRLFHMPQKIVPKLQLKLYGSLIEQVNELKFLGLIFDSNLNWKAHLTGVANKVSRIIGLLHKLKYFFPSYI